MSLRINATLNSPRKPVQIVESYPVGEKARLRVLGHGGVAHSEEPTELNILYRKGRASPVSDDTANGP